MPSYERTQQLQAAILDHLKTVGPRDWEEVQKDFLDIARATFWRNVQKVKEQLEKPLLPTPAPDLFGQKDEMHGHAEASETPKANVVLRLLKHTERFYELYADILALRKHALDDNGQVRDTNLFAKTIRLRNQLLNDELKVVEEVNRAIVNTQYFDAVIEAVTKTSPEVAAEIMDSLNALNKGGASSGEAGRRD